MSGRGRELLLLAAAALVLFGVRLGARDLWTPNEPAYGRAVVEMARSGEWVVPTINGEPFVEKPILYYWLARLSALAGGGVNEATLRAPSVAAGVAAVLLVFLLVRPYSGAGRARLAAAVLATTWVVCWSARAVQMDLLLTACVLAALVAVSRVLDHGLAPWAGWALAGTAAGAGWLAKGPVGLLLPGMVALAYAAATGRARGLFRPALLAGVACFALVAVPWPLLLWAREGGDALTELLWRQNVTRFHAPWDHARPWWYFLAYFWVDMAPWVLLVPLAARLPGRDAGERRLDRLAWLWIVLPVAFFSLSASKRSTYVMPVAPAVAVLVSGLLERLGAGALERWRGRAVAGVLAALGVLLAAAGAWAGRWLAAERPELSAVGLPVVGLSLAAGAVLVAGLWPSPPARRAAPAALFAYAVSVYLWAGAAVLPALDPYKSARPFSLAVAALVGPDEPLRAWHHWRWRSRYVYYTDRRIEQLDDLGELRRYWQSPERVFLVVERGELAEVRPVIGDARPLVDRPVGSNHAYLFANR